MEKQKSVPIGIKCIIGFHILNIIIWIIGQGGAVVAYDTVAQWGLQEPRATIDPFILMINQAIGLADFIIGVPLFIIAAVGLWQMRFYGFVFSYMVLGISFYWTTVAWVKQYFYLQAGVKSLPFDIGTHGMLAFVFLFSLWASWHLFKNRRLFDQGTKKEVSV